VDEHVRSEMQRQKIPGLSLAVVRNGEVVKARGYGSASLELNVPATADTVYYIAHLERSYHPGER
jgi:CubicO group peptidase (beta-lactamase class C family)